MLDCCGVVVFTEFRRLNQKESIAKTNDIHLRVGETVKIAYTIEGFGPYAFLNMILDQYQTN